MANRPNNFIVPRNDFETIFEALKILKLDFKSSKQSFKKYLDYGICFKFDEKNPEKLMVFGVNLNNPDLIKENEKSISPASYSVGTPLMVLKNGKIAKMGVLDLIIQQKSCHISPIPVSNLMGKEIITKEVPNKDGFIKHIIQNQSDFSDKINAPELQDFNLVFFPATMIAYLLCLSTEKEKSLTFYRGISNFNPLGSFCTLLATPTLLKTGSSNIKMRSLTTNNTNPPPDTHIVAATTGVPHPPPY